MAEDLLHDAQVRAAVEQMRRRGVAQRVRTDGPAHRRTEGARDDVVRGPRAQASAAGPEEDRARGGWRRGACRRATRAGRPRTR